MLLVIDVGNTNIVMGIYNNDKLICDFRMHTNRDMTEDEFNVTVNAILGIKNISSKNIDKVVISCVVPPVMNFIDSFCYKYIGVKPLWIDSKSIANIMPILYKNPSEVGADRIVNAVAAFNKYKCSLIVIDFGTATTFDAISFKGEYLGGAISPGINISADALFLKTSKLPRVEIFSPPESVIGKTTTDSIKSGIIFGYAGLVDNIVKRMKNEMKTNPKVIATGGLSTLIAGVAETIESVEPILTLEGLRLIGNSL